MEVVQCTVHLISVKYPAIRAIEKALFFIYQRARQRLLRTIYQCGMKSIKESTPSRYSTDISPATTTRAQEKEKKNEEETKVFISLPLLTYLINILLLISNSSSNFSLCKSCFLIVSLPGYRRKRCILHVLHCRVARAYARLMGRIVILGFTTLLGTV